VAYIYYYCVLRVKEDKVVTLYIYAVANTVHFAEDGQSLASTKQNDRTVQSTHTSDLV